MFEIEIKKLNVKKEFVRYLSIAWNGDIEIHLSFTADGQPHAQFEKCKNLCAMYDQNTIEDVAIGNHKFSEDEFEFSCKVRPGIPKKLEDKIEIVLIPRNGKALEIEIENLIIPKELIQIIQCKENNIRISIIQPNTDMDTHTKFEELIAMCGYYEKKEIDTIKIGSHLENQNFSFYSNPVRGIAGVSKGSIDITLTKI